ncbi:HEPN domain-containing protein [Acinetobacter nematophilus]|uniref:HEPN domain-containing protein n=1 Tax=Acinetobacter nematophilus TaxID=2994642 RepID=A0A9X3IH06_9GAMM|nr:HEPN domain-containing protein [Acinetobacter nematophilus]MCX5466809.1 HEPN domain-containing protein [Acinetobacter nematophilus]
MLVLEEVYKSKKAENSEQFNLRIHRGLSWLKKAVILQSDLDLKFISLWIALNAIHPQSVKTNNDEQDFSQFFNSLVRLDREQKIQHIVWDRYHDAIARLIESPYTFQNFWDDQNQKINQKVWKQAFLAEKKQVSEARQAQDTICLLRIVFQRLLTLQHQLILGGATYNSSMNRKLLQDGCNILIAVIPASMHIILENPQNFDFDTPFYPLLQVS